MKTRLQFDDIYRIPSSPKTSPAPANTIGKCIQPCRKPDLRRNKSESNTNGTFIEQPTGKLKSYFAVAFQQAHTNTIINCIQHHCRNSDLNLNSESKTNGTFVEQPTGKRNSY